MSKNSRIIISVGLLILALAVMWALRGGSGKDDKDGGSTKPAKQSAAAASPARGASEAPKPGPATKQPPAPDAPAGIPTVRPGDLPAEAQRTLQLIDAGGPFPYRKDGTVFSNRERRLPQQNKTDYYREYTVPTPGEGDRGARRIIGGGAGERFYTADHYRTFRFIVR